MADIKISELTAALTVGDSDVIPMTASGSTVKASASLLKQYNNGTTDISGIGDGTVTGAISALDNDKAPKSDLASIKITGSTNNTGNTIAKGTYFYKDGALVKAKTDIANGATLTSGTNYSTVTAGGLNALNTDLPKRYEGTSLATVLTTGAYTNVAKITIPKTGVYLIIASYLWYDAFTQFACAALKKSNNVILKQNLSALNGNYSNLTYVSSFTQGDEIFLSAYQESGSSVIISQVHFDAISVIES